MTSRPMKPPFSFHSLIVMQEWGMRTMSGVIQPLVKDHPPSQGIGYQLVEGGNSKGGKT